MLERHAPDVACFQEADGPSSWSGSFDQLHYLAEAASFVSELEAEQHPAGRAFDVTLDP